MEAGQWLVEQCSPPLRALALYALHAGLPADQRVALPAALEAAADKFGERAWEGLFVCWRAGDEGPQPEIIAATWVQPLAGNTAVLWPPSPNVLALSSLLSVAAGFVDEQGFRLAQLVVSASDGYPAEEMTRGGFAPLVELVYLHRETAALGVPSGELRFIANAGPNLPRLKAVLQATYDGSLDCPALDGIRPLDEVVAGYQAQGEHRPERWYVVEDSGDDVGALILAFHREVENCELVYMGVTPAARGRGCGRHIVQFAVNAAAEMGARRLVLAVDASNAPALRVYGELDFTEWDRRLVYARLQARA
jgi:mycothiol synthase